MSPALRLSLGPRSRAVEPRSMMISPSGTGAVEGWYVVSCVGSSSSRLRRRRRARRWGGRRPGMPPRPPWRRCTRRARRRRAAAEAATGGPASEATTGGLGHRRDGRAPAGRPPVRGG